MTEILRELQRDHRNTAHLLDLFERELAVLEQGEERPNYELIAAVVEYFLAYPDLVHHPREDLVYELLRRRDPAAAETVGDLLDEHRGIAELTRRFAVGLERVLADFEMPRNDLVALGSELIASYRLHMQREESDFFPPARERLTTEDWTRAEAEFAQESDPLFGPAVEERFAPLRAEIDDMARDEH